MNKTPFIAVVAAAWPLFGSHGPGSRHPESAGKSETLNKVAGRVFQSLLKKDWNRFRKDAAPGICVQSFSRGYDDYFAKDFQSLPFDKELDSQSSRYVAYMSSLDGAKPLNAEDRKVYDGFCYWIKQSRNYTSPAWDWPFVETSFEPSKTETEELNGPAAWGKVASNVDVRVEFEKSTGRWRAFRLVVEAH